ncbi:MAG: hypothetical protein RMJ00_03960 [Nitrososphaerota archaeon]|nr:hypothetical protein [Candidatus Bathyarchaeota archaeon]MDW8061833.1 hypothetical protein [Nitrososphaerota archaeon]
MVKSNFIYTMVEALKRRGGSAEDEELYLDLSKISELARSDFMKLLMKLEILGLVRVYRLSKDRFKVELVSRD